MIQMIFYDHFNDPMVNNLSGISEIRIHSSNAMEIDPRVLACL
jgi:hypothetical protein